MREINLLPKPKQRELFFQIALRSLYGVVAFSVASFAMVLLTQFGAKLYLNQQLQSIQERIVQLKGQVSKSENAQVRQQVVNLNNRIIDYKNLSETAPKWSKVLKAFAVLPPSEVKINSFVLDFNKKSINITGFSPTREKVIETYYSILNDNSNFYNIDYPLENVAKAKDITFHFTFFVKDELLK